VRVARHRTACRVLVSPRWRGIRVGNTGVERYPAAADCTGCRSASARPTRSRGVYGRHSQSAPRPAPLAPFVAILRSLRLRDRHKKRKGSPPRSQPCVASIDAASASAAASRTRGIEPTSPGCIKPTNREPAAERIPRAADRFAECIPVLPSGAARPGYNEPTWRELRGGITSASRFAVPRFGTRPIRSPKRSRGVYGRPLRPSPRPAPLAPLVAILRAAPRRVRSRLGRG